MEHHWNEFRSLQFLVFLCVHFIKVLHGEVKMFIKLNCFTLTTKVKSLTLSQYYYKLSPLIVSAMSISKICRNCQEEEEEESKKMKLFQEN